MKQEAQKVSSKHVAQEKNMFFIFRRENRPTEMTKYIFKIKSEIGCSKLFNSISNKIY